MLLHVAACCCFLQVAASLAASLQAELAALYPALRERCGTDGALLAQHAQRGHAEIAAVVDGILAGMLEQQQQQQGQAGGQPDARQAWTGREAAVKRMQQLEQV